MTRLLVLIPSCQAGQKGAQFCPLLRRGGRAVEYTGLEIRHSGNVIGGSNPSPSATTNLYKL